MSRETEFRAYIWIENRLQELGWDTRNPNRTPTGQVWSQQEVSEREDLREALGGQRPESVAILDANTFWMIEAKHDLSKLSLALEEAVEYAEALNGSVRPIRSPIASGVAGSEAAGFIVESKILIDGAWETVLEGEQPCSRLLSHAEIQRMVIRGLPQVIPSYLSVSESVELAGKINAIMHSAKIELEKRALYVALLILALNQDASISYAANPQIFLDDINSRASRPFIECGRDALWQSVKISYSNETLNDKALGLSRVLDLIRSADIANAARGTDLLGDFFESFLKYGNTSKELGVVLTPRHVCALAADAIGVSRDDIVVDIAAGTGGFLVAAYNKVRARETADIAKSFAAQNIYGCEDSGSIAALAFINMYLRGDGKHNLKIDSCFNWDLVKDGDRGQFVRRVSGPLKEPKTATRALMNPPFSLKTSVQKEIDFIDHGLRQLVRNGRLFAVLPASIMYDRENLAWRQSLLKFHSLVAVISFPTDLFYPVATETVGVFLKAGTAHQKADDVLWIRVIDDGFVKRKRFRVERRKGSSREALSSVGTALRDWVSNGVKQNTIAGEIEYKPITSDELVPHAHLGTRALLPGSLREETVQVVKNMITELWARPK